jgi:uncharacterized SAM-binding protein YcdF (DUF218 family)
MVEWLVVGPVALALGWGGAAFALDRHGRRRPPARTYDALILAGCRVYPDGRPSPALTRRVQLATELYHAGVAPLLVLTGGQNAGAPVSEARAAAELCLLRGVPPASLILEERSTDTLENAAFSARLVSGEVLLVSDAAHVYRARRMFRRHFVHVDAIGAIPPGGPRVRMALREVASLVRHGALGHL